MTGKRCAVIGAGPCGLTGARWALEYGMETVIFEASGETGGLWVYKAEETNLSSVMKSTVINTSKEMSAFSDYVPPAESSPFMHNTEMLKYFRSYAEHHGVVEHIRFNHTVENIERSSDYERTGKWDVIFRDNDNGSRRETFDYVLLAVGHHAFPNWPKPWPGQDQFQGKIIHSHSYKDFHGFEDKVNVGVGIGNSGADVVAELSRCSKQVYLSTRRGAWVLPKLGDYGRPIDMSLNNRWNWYKNKIPGYTNWKRRQEFFEYFDHNAYGLQPKHAPNAQHPTMSDDIPSRILQGTIVVKPDIKRFTKTGIEWIDGTVTEPVDNVILSTGYKFDFPLLENGKLIPVHNNHVQGLYKNMWPTTLAKHNSLAIIGLCQPVGALFPVAEMQARVFFHHATGRVKLPSGSKMDEEIEEYQRSLRDRYVDSPRHTIQVDFIDYMDEMGNLLGCVPNPLDYVVSDPVLAYHLVFRAVVPYAYRLKGPNAWPGARDAIIKVDERLQAATRTRDPGFKDGPGGTYTYFIAAALILLFLYLIF
ncbi:Protein FMO-2 [Aphelenchoides avenae]|nr:Protein FMO-2 [Aphelenchus avenae]